MELQVVFPTPPPVSFLPLLSRELMSSRFICGEVIKELRFYQIRVVFEYPSQDAYTCLLKNSIHIRCPKCFVYNICEDKDTGGVTPTRSTSQRLTEVTFAYGWLEHHSLEAAFVISPKAAYCNGESRVKHINKDPKDYGNITLDLYNYNIKLSVEGLLFCVICSMLQPRCLYYQNRLERLEPEADQAQTELAPAPYMFGTDNSSRYLT
ncbi:hypothetical protein M8C21_009281 [Ambrosia artemisiifolia]|uniref:Uncharacterized protein n=1 Tax=Ambrosia artemisiifolia TaxID=4212 RepID=A0AAD5C2Y0_AMBAR|nr:hypothetical protein M8C21_009281 [Ambrosia artemisiifolia]